MPPRRRLPTSGPAARPSPTPGKRALRRVERTDAFLDAALRIVGEEGVEGLTIAALAAEVGAAVGALYRYFPGKDDLLAALQERALDALAGELSAVAVRPPLARIVAVAAEVATLAERDARRHRLLDELLSAPAPVYSEARARALEEHLARVLAVVEEAFAAAAGAGALSPGDAALRTRVLWSAIHGAGHLRKRDRLEPPPLRHRRVEAAAVEALLVGFGARPASAHAALRGWPRAPR